MNTQPDGTLYKCIHPGLPFWRADKVTMLSSRLEQGDIVLDMGERPTRFLGDLLYRKVFHNGIIGWVRIDYLEELTELARAKNKKQKSAKRPVPLPQAGYITNIKGERTQ